jgi:hypothetical protein
MHTQRIVAHLVLGSVDRGGGRLFLNDKSLLLHGGERGKGCGNFSRHVVIIEETRSDYERNGAMSGFPHLPPLTAPSLLPANAVVVLVFHRQGWYASQGPVPCPWHITHGIRIGDQKGI